MATKPSGRGKLKCGLCYAFVDPDQYRAHVVNCGKPNKENEAQPVLKVCPFCNKQVKDLAQHSEMCPNNERGSNSRQASPKSLVRPQSKSIIVTKKAAKKCPTCSDMISEDEFEDHIDGCEEEPPRKPPVHKKVYKKCPTCSDMINEDEFEDHIDDCHRRRPRKPPAHKKILKTCPICSKTFDEGELKDHIDGCDGGRPEKPPVHKKVYKKCPTCSDMINEDEFEDHIDGCDRGRSRRPPAHRKTTKKCPLCSDMINEDEFEDHIDGCDRGRPRRPPVHRQTTKKCPACSRTIDEVSYEDHVYSCDGGRSRRPPAQRKTTKKCPACSRTIDEDSYEDHVYSCDRRLPQKPPIARNTEECPICFKVIAQVDYQSHVTACADKISSVKKTNTPSRTRPESCFTCSSAVDGSKSSGHTIPCRTRHLYCLKCLQRSMNEFIGSNTPPVCHLTLCDYELSLYDVECLPLPADTIKPLLALVKSTQRPQCPLCLFYVDFKTMEDFQRHAISCSSADMAECKQCHCLYNRSRMTDHAQQCRNNSHSQQQEMLIDFILPRTKYPVTSQQMRVFLEHRRKNRLPQDPHSLVNALADFGSTFPFEIPTRDCDICADACVYEDIFVFGCEESHKLCYECFANSCTAKMNAKEILTCPMCAYQLPDGEIKELRVPADQKQQFLEYQTEKTFRAYTGGEAVVRCPNKECQWVAELQRPNERFQVQCPLCNYQFCSFCNQQYHFRTTCQQMPEINQRWFFWCNTQRGEYWQARAQQDANFRAQLEDYQQQQVANTQRNEELRLRYNDLLADENYKAQNCRLCPNCQRVVQHLGGCNAMICGQNYHGGDVQSGCGHKFDWSQATPYAPIGNTGPEQVRNDMPAPEQQQAVVHEGVQCDSCHNDVQGIRFDCVHCASLIFCEKCEQRATLEHSNQIRDQQKQQHVFQLITNA